MSVILRSLFFIEATHTVEQHFVWAGKVVQGFTTEWTRLRDCLPNSETVGKRAYFAQAICFFSTHIPTNTTSCFVIGYNTVSVCNYNLGYYWNYLSYTLTQPRRWDAGSQSYSRRAWLNGVRVRKKTTTAGSFN